jgi:molecular chaperone DnaK (HSP70)
LRQNLQSFARRKRFRFFPLFCILLPHSELNLFRFLISDYYKFRHHQTQTKSITEEMIGIALGHHSFAVAVHPRGIVANPHGSRTTPTRVALSDGEKPVVGESAVNHPDEIPASHPQFWPAVLAYAKEIARQVATTSDQATTVVVAAPQSLHAAIRGADKTVLVVEDAPMALMGYDLDEPRDLPAPPTTVAVLDYAHTVSRWTVFSIQHDGLIVPLGSTVEQQVPSLTERLENYLGDEFRRKHKLIHKESKRAVSKLARAAEDAKHRLSVAPQTSVEIDSFFEGIDFFTSVTRSKFEQLVDDALVAAAATPANRPDCAVVLVGGGAKVPRLRTHLKASTVYASIAPDEVVALGAAKQAALVAQGGTKVALDGAVRGVVMLPAEVGLLMGGDRFVALLPRGSLLPVKRVFVASTDADDQDAVRITVAARYLLDSSSSSNSNSSASTTSSGQAGEGQSEGEKDEGREEVEELGVLVLRGFAKKPRGSVRIDVSLEAEVDGRITVRAKAPGAETKLDIPAPAPSVL